MDRATVAYAIPTGLLSFALLGGGFANLSQSPDMVANMTAMQLPTYLMGLLGIWKLLAVVAILAPGFPRIKEWAYAGVFFLLTGAAWCHIGAGEGFGKAVPALVVLGIAMASWWLRPASRRIG